MCQRATLHRLVDSLPEDDLQTAGRVLAGLMAADPLELALLLAPIDDEVDTDDEDGGLTEARAERARGEGVSTEVLERELGLA